MARLTAPGSRFEIGREDVRGRELAVFTRRHRHLTELLQASAAFGDTEYLVSRSERITYAQLHDRVAAASAALRADFGVRPGDRVAICAANCPAWVVAYWAIVAAGGIAVGMNAMWAPAELRYGLELTRPRLVLADSRRRDLLGLSDLPLVALEEFAGPVQAGACPEAAPVGGDEDDPATILFTSGTSGRPKGVAHSHRNVVSAVWFHLLNDAVATELGNPPRGRRFLMTSPLFHIGALHNLAVVRLAVGDTAVIHEGRFDLDDVLRLVEQEKVTNWAVVPTMASRLAERAELRGLDDLDLTSLRTVSINSAPSSPLLKERLRRALPVAARSLGTSYGLTESSTAATLATADELARDPATVGRPIPTMAVQVRDDAGDPVPAGTEGEIWLRGPGVMLGYWADEVATRAATDGGGWLRTGDLGTPLASGHLHVSSRRSDLILRGGENVYPAEVEEQLTTQPAVAECVVLGIPDPDLGEAVGAVVVVRPDHVVSEDELVAHLRPLLARYKQPVRWTITTEPLPRNAMGKVDRGAAGLRL